MRLRVLIFLVLALVIAACQGPPPTMYVLVVTATPEGGTAVAASADNSADTTQEAPTEEPEIPTTPTITPTPDPFPTPVINQVQVAEERFEHGRMIWLRPVDQIWVMLDEDADGQGVWRIYDDTFEEGEMEFDPELEPPEGLHQPIRGFGKLWRENLEVREALGWALEPEVGYVTRYEYHFGGQVDENNVYTPGPGYHIVENLFGEVYRFDEESGTWEIIESGPEATAEPSESSE
ncbi:MAG: hypothetical protein D6712_10905 [Chloroflexi bacterium]|nr:MAG: hypothetical protein D6712_10905 [Chloroflexota bacterium]